MEQNLEIKTKGCVYFFRHIGLTPIKIGYSTNESPISRFEQFKTYAPFGSEIIGFIRTYDAKELETTLHERFSQYRLSGEWFEITTEQCETIISFYSNIEDIKEKNDFQIAWAKHINEKCLIPTEENFNLKESGLRNIFYCFESKEPKFLFNTKISNNDIFNYYNESFYPKLTIKGIKSLIKEYCKLKKYYYSDSATNGIRYFSIDKNAN